MARVAEHLSIAELEERFRTAKDPILARHVQVIWLLAQGHTSAEVSTVTSFVPRWIEPLRARYNAEGFAALGDLRRHNGRAPSLLKPDLLERLRVRLADPPPDGGLWTSGKVARWMAGELGLASVCVQRGWEALRAIEWSIQKPRPRHPKAATPEEKSTPPPRPEAGPAPRLGAQGRAPDRARPPPLQVALRHGLRVPDGIRLFHLPSYTPELQPAERLWPVLDEPVVNTYFATLADLEAVIAQRCIELDSQDLRTGTNFHWWPKPVQPK